MSDPKRKRFDLSVLQEGYPKCKRCDCYKNLGLIHFVPFVPFFGLSVLAARVFDVAPDPPNYEGQAGDSNQEIKTVEPGLQRIVLVPLLTEFHAHIRKAETPGQGSGKGVDAKASEIHSRDTRRKGDEGSDRGQ
jgi:hypothetical protein